MHTFFRILAVGSLVLAVSLANAGEKKLDRTFPVSPGGTLVVDTDLGSIQVTGGSAGTVVVAVVVRGSERDLERFDISASESGGVVEVKGDLQKKAGWRSRDLDATFTVKVPKEYNVKVRTAGGDIAIAEIKGDVRGSTSGGDVRLKDVEGPVNVKTSGGDVSVQAVTGDLKAQTSGGNVEVERVTGSVDAGTSGGNVRVSGVNGRVEAETSGGNVMVSVTGGNSGIHAGTSGGNIEIVIPEDVGATVDASTSGGSVICDLPLTVSGRIHESHVKGTVKGGGGPIVARTSGGNIRIRGSK